MFYKILVAILFGTTVLSVQIKDVPEDGRLNFTGLALKYCRAVQEYDVTTEDGYILRLFRIPGKSTTPVLLMHGLWATSDDFILRGNDSLSVTLTNADYDLWIGNYRGNRYSRRHKTMNPDTNSTFWEFGPHEHGYYDLAAFIDFVLNNTGQEKLSVIAHSEGVMSTYILGAERPEYNEKIRVLIAMAPICHLDKLKANFPPIVELGYFASRLVRCLNIHELGGHDSVTGAVTRSFCTQTVVGIEACRRFIFITSGYDAESIESDFIPILFSHYPAGTSRRNLEHFLQIIASKSFANFDHGPVKNMRRYKSIVAPKYDLNKVTMATYLIAAKNDLLSVLGDTRRQARELPNVKEYMVIEDALFNHIDFLWSRKSHNVLHPKILEILRIYN